MALPSGNVEPTTPEHGSARATVPTAAHAPTLVAHPATRPRERDVITAFAEITGEAIGDADLEQLLRSVCVKLCTVLGVSRSSLYLRRPDGRFRGAAGHCADEGDITEAVKRQESGIAGDHFSREIIETARSVLIEDVPNDPRPHRRTMEHWRVRAMLGVPLVFDGEVIGLLFVDNKDLPRRYTAEDIEIAEMFAQLSALFLTQAMLNSRLRAQASEITRSRNTLAYLADVHRKLTNAVLEGADIQRVVRLLSDLSTKPVVLYDEDFRVLAWAAPVTLGLDRAPVISEQIRRMPSVEAELAGLSPDRPSAVVPPTLSVGLGRRHLLCRLMIEGKPNGYLGIVEVGRSLEQVDANIAEHGATVLSLQILSERRQIETQGQARDDYLSDLLRNTRDKEHLVRRGPQFGIDLTYPHVLVRFTLAANQRMSASAAQRLVTRRFQEVLGIDEPAAVKLPGSVIVLVPLPDDGCAEELQRVRDAVSRIRASLQPQLATGATVISGVCREVTDFSQAAREMREVAEIARSFEWSAGVLDVTELGLFRLVVSSGRVKEAVHFAHEYLHAVQTADDGVLLDTWRAFVTAEGRVQGAAQTLDVHENTVRYRMGKIKELTRLDPASLDVMLSARLAFQILDFSGS
ncbi:GAF domain-containing protein [Rhodococcus ruber]|uniref:Putative CdaR family transcriptional regulator n=1 Tax=Rhodococcus ruber TaxID=1830 RepID=A0A098BGI8_9NOCA|nr:GAF domain-containing protein [Rhodococcus ruber]MCD2128955.1 GAF domain-containing protein [Rhodococcus ruber]MCZ4504803.1 GAF domain-containing protein [Rhodococcus ruber]MCZ4532511.1 GAF domain-containing protein [Rhodococcus ruber]MCZ4623052.1 GAF domain-containing protein [Rhodococcus ruber]MDI9969785.1 GAF domain-containing protein [Rhodococcus ruber]